jgi:hypothetical protein
MWDFCAGYPSREWLTDVTDEHFSAKIALHHVASQYGPLPQHDEIYLAIDDLTGIGVARPELALVFLKEDRAVFGIIVEEISSKDEVKRYNWPAFCATLRARLRCPTCLLVMTYDEAVSRWAAEPIELGGDNRFVPYVLEPADKRRLIDLLATENPYLAIMSKHFRRSEAEYERKWRGSDT